ncbi:polyprenol reductase isoform X3 [Neopelma chrysocephalum]|uniref:polyprenol reductase isoform X3 n=1 Tax=Neopelma chrysocephalum TaxID=114329 RepID=UPI000FCD4747|nr:polyprenol reductase isoform X3 [Neopelma chrysocephalum]
MLPVLAAIWSLPAVAFLAALLLLRAPAWRSDGRGGVSDLFHQLIRYGKTRLPGWSPNYLVPKSWFTHFYVVSVVWNGSLLYWLFRAEFLGESLPSWIQDVHRALGKDSQSEDMADSEYFSALLVLLLLWLHSCRRLAECLWTSVFSSGFIHIVQYYYGLGFYIAVGSTVLCQVPTNVRTGKVVRLGYDVPFGDWFESVSCPHYFAELLIYVSMAIMLGFQNVTWWCVVMCVLFNQALAAVLSHEFYEKNFHSYPKHRKAFIPHVF